MIARSAGPWSVTVSLDEVPETGRHVELHADERVRTAIAELAGLAALPRLEAFFDVSRRGRDGLHVVGEVSATVGQTCVVTLEPIENTIEEPVDIVFIPGAGQDAEAEAATAAVGQAVEVPIEDAPEPLINGAVDLGAVATEFLILGIDPYPRKPEAVFESPAPESGASHPFAALAALKKGQDKQ